MRKCSFCYDPIDRPPVDTTYESTAVYQDERGYVMHGACYSRKRAHLLNWALDNEIDAWVQRWTRKEVSS